MLQKNVTDDSSYGPFPLARAQIGGYIVLLLVAACLFSACGGDDDPKECDFGERDYNAGKCLNPESCRVDRDCLPGYECGQEYACTPLETCEGEGDCEVGRCEAGACVNPDSCEEDADCLERTFCDGGSCEPDPCDEVHCARGVCERGTGRCVSSGSCTEATEQYDCAAGERCADGECHPEETYCDELDCQRGECSFERGGCVGKKDCEGDDQLCAEGYFCNDQDRCERDLCAEYGVECKEGGRCLPSVGVCENAVPCTADADCLAKHVCVGGTCRFEEAACGDADGDGGCPGNQICEIDDGAECLEPDECVTSFDCAEGRQCGGLTCLDAVACDDDHFEPNDGRDEAVGFLDGAVEGTLHASACASDVDVFSLQSGELAGREAEGTLVVEVDVDERVRGLGRLDLSVVDPDGDEHHATTGPMGVDGSARLELPVAADDHGEYLLEVASGDDVSPAGVRYELSANLWPDEALEACEEAIELDTDSAVTGDTDRSESRALSSRCGGDELASEVLYAIDVDEPREVLFELDPVFSETDLTMSLRRRCTQPSSESYCVDEGLRADGESMQALLEEGRHYLIVEAAGEQRGGPFELELTSTRLACTDADDHCESAQTTNRCAHDGGQFHSVACSQGCNPSTGRCSSPEGDACVDAPLIDGTSDDGQPSPTSFSDEVDLLELDDDYRIGAASCITRADTQTDGPDKSYRIELSPGMGVEASVNFSNEAEGSLYFVTDCAAADESCLEGTASSGELANRESLHYGNDGENDETLYLVVDTAADQLLETAEVDIDIVEMRCEPGEFRCRSESQAIGTREYSEQCDEHGMQWFEYEECGDWGCWEADGWCAQADECWQAIDISEEAKSGTADFEFGWQDLTNENEGDMCGLTDSDLAGGDAYFRVDAAGGQRIKASVSPTTTGFAPAVVATADCDAPGDDCRAGDAGQARRTVVTHRATVDETLFVIADGDFENAGDNTRLQVKLTEDCSGFATGETRCDDASTLERCMEDGDWEPFYCENGCWDGECQPPNGEYCHDVIDATGDAAQTGGVTYSGDFDDFRADFADFNCLDHYQHGSGDDVVYRVDLSDGERLEASLSGGTGTYPALAISTDCWNATNTCVDGDRSYLSSAEAQASHTAEGDQTVYVIAARSAYWGNGEFTLELAIDP